MRSIVKINSPDSQGWEKKVWLDAALPSLELQHVWYEIKHDRHWKSMALISVVENINILTIAHSFGLMAVREPHDLVWVVNTAGRSTEDIRQDLTDEDQDTDEAFPYRYTDLTSLEFTKEKQLFTAERLLEQFAGKNPNGTRFIFAVDSLLSQTHAISLARSVDSVILGITIGKTSFKDVRRTVEIVGEDKVLGGIVLRPCSS